MHGQQNIKPTIICYKQQMFKNVCSSETLEEEHTVCAGRVEVHFFLCVFCSSREISTGTSPIQEDVSNVERTLSFV